MIDVKKSIIILVIAITLSSLAYASEFTVITQSNFDEGTYTNTFFNTTSFIELNRSQNLKFTISSSSASNTHTSTLTSYATDGNTGSAWNAGAAAAEWLKVDLGQKRIITQIRLLPDGSPDGTVYYNILGSNDDSNFTTIAYQLTADTTGSSTWSNNSILPRTYRYIMINCTDWANSWVAIREVEFYGINTGNYTTKVFDGSSNSEWTTLKFVRDTNTELPNNGETDTTPGGVNLSKTALLLHMNNNWTDMSGLRHDGTASGATFTTSSKFGSHAGSFDGTNDYVDVGDSDKLTFGTKATFASWIYLISAPTESVSIINKWNQDINDEYIFYITSAKKLGFAWHTTGSNAWGNTAFNGKSVVKVPLGEWTHVAVVRDGTTLKNYINGIKLYEGTDIDNNPFRNGITSVRIGGQNRGSQNRYFPGYLDEIIMLNRSLSNNDILKLYRRGVSKQNISIRSCNDASCSGETFSEVTGDTPITISTTNNQYFQYQFEFDQYFKLYNTSITYSAVGGGVSVPEFSDYATIFLLLTIISGFMFMRRAE